MKSILEELYYGNIDPNVTSFSRYPQYGKAMKVINENEDKLFKLLNEPEKNLFSDYPNAQMEVLGLTALHKFSIGFKIGTLLAMEIIANKEEWLHE